jgi:putative GTP pyrophosphokinase
MGNSEAVRAPNRREFERRYGVQRFYYESVLQELELRVKGSIENSGIRPVMKYRVKSFESFFQKYLKLLEQDALPDSSEIHDMIGMRVICPFIEDVKRVEEVLQVCFDVREIERKGAEHSFKEFGYESVHMLVRIPKDLKDRYGGLDIDICEIQVRTILQEAWAEVEHELVYKARFDPKDDPMKRKLAAINAILSLSDLIFQDIREYQRRFMDEISVRRSSFYDKVEREIDRELFGTDEEPRLAQGAAR